VVRRIGAALASAALCLIAVACATQSRGVAVGGSRQVVEDWALPLGFRAEPLETAGFRLFALRRQFSPAAVLTIYIEGDGAPWPNLFQPPADPTPRHPVALALADRDPSPAVAYLARPCQYLENEEERRGCDVAYWSGRRFAPEAVAAMDEAVNRLKASAGARHVRLVGYSGGGVIAALLAQRRHDVSGLVTIAAPLALSEWTAAHQLSPLTGSLDPLGLRPGAAWVSAFHFAGAEDAIVPPAIVARFVQAHGGRMEIIARFDHDCCWARDWADLLRRVRNGGVMP
jgi:dienelactone hydrolase